MNGASSDSRRGKENDAEAVASMSNKENPQKKILASFPRDFAVAVAPCVGVEGTRNWKWLAQPPVEPMILMASCTVNQGGCQQHPITSGV